MKSPSTPPRRDPSATKRTYVATVVAALTCLLGLLVTSTSVSCNNDAPANGNVLWHRQPSGSQGVSDVARLTDGVAAVDGDPWRSDLTVVVPKDGFVVYDLGAPTHLQFLFLQGDNDDAYEVEGSLDGQTFTHVWTAEPARGRGMRVRSTDQLDVTTRYLRFTASGGDGSYCLGEIAAFGNRPDVFPPAFARREGQSSTSHLRAAMVRWAAACLLAVIISRKKGELWRKLALALPIVLGVWLAFPIAQLWPLAERELSMLRAVLAAVGGGTLLWEAFCREEDRPPRTWVNVLLVATATLSMGCYYHLGHLQFHDHARDRQTFVHPWDMRVYFPVAKYFEELRFDGLYLASVAAYLDDAGAGAPRAASGITLRDLTNNEMKHASDLMGPIVNVRFRFSDERWKSFKKDMRYFRDTMGTRDYLGSLRDHGGNATPVWILVAHLLFRNAPANELTLSLAGLIDPALMILLLIAIYRSFGLRALLVVMIVYGTTDFSRFGTNLVGSTLRADWIVALGLGACALKTGRNFLGGVFLAYGGLVRAFPALAAITLVFPSLFWAIDWIRARRGATPPAGAMGTVRAFLRASWIEQRPLLRTALGGTLCATILIAASSYAFTYQGSWGAWIQKITMHAEKPNANHVGLRTVVAHEPDKVAARVIHNELPEPWVDWQKAQLDALARRKPWWLAGVALFTSLVVMGCRRRRLDQAALLGMFLVPVLFYPANYYCHYVCLLPLIAAGEADDARRKLSAWISFALLMMGVAQYQTVLEGWSDVCYYEQSVILLAGYLAVLGPYAWDACRDLPWAGRLATWVRSSSAVPSAGGMVNE